MISRGVAEFRSAQIMARRVGSSSDAIMSVNAAFVRSAAADMRRWGMPEVGDRCVVCADIVPELVYPRTVSATVAWVDAAKDLLGLQISKQPGAEVFALGDYLVTWWYEGDQREVIFT
jgi:hypothetical protein